jgi:hypothetical protein
VAGSNLYRIAADGTPTVLGSLPGAGKLFFAGNGIDIVFSNRYVLTEGNVEAITDPDLPAVQAIDYIDGYIVWAESGTGRWGSSRLYDAQDYDALDYAVAESAPDDLVTLMVDHGQVLLFGQETTEQWYNAGTGGFAFSRVPGAVIEYGCLARHGVAKQDNSVFWLAHDRTIRVLRGQTALRVSTHAVEEKLSSFSRVDDCEAFAHTWNGHLMVTFRFPEAGATWVLDVTTGEWHERESFGAAYWKVVDTAECYGKVFVQASDTGAVGYLSDTYYTEFGTTLRRSWTYPQVYATNKRLFHSQLELVARTGDAPSGEEPQVLLDISDDGGNTWRAMPSRKLGRTGQHAKVIRWAALGSARDRVYRMSLDDSRVPLNVLDTTLEVSG